MKKLIVFLSLLTVAGFTAFSQSEGTDLITYDSVINVRNVSNNGQGNGGLVWKIKVTRRRNYFAEVAADSSFESQIFVFIPGAGEVQSGNATTDEGYLTAYGAHYWLLNGWDGTLKLGNGTHAPMYVTALQPVSNTRPWFTQGLLEDLRTVFKPRHGKFNVFGLSQGSYEWACGLLYSNNVANNPQFMSMIATYTNLEGVGPETFQSFDYTYASGFGLWASGFNGKFFGIEGTGDTRNVWQISQPTNAGKAGSAYFAWTNYGGGGHGSSGPDGNLWNWVYDPKQQNWQCTAPITNPYILAGAQPMTMGTYYVDATNGSSMFQWALRQTDTLIAGGGLPTGDSTAPAAVLEFFMGEYVTTVAKDGVLYAISSNLRTTGTNQTGVLGRANAVQGIPTGLQFSAVNGILHGGLGITTTGRVFSFGGNGQGAAGVGTTSDVLVGTEITTDSAGVSLKNMFVAQGTYCANTAEGLYLVKHGGLSDTIYFTGQSGYGIRGDGTNATNLLTRPTKVWPLPSGLRVVEMDASKYGVALLSDGSVWVTGGGQVSGAPQTYATLGYTPTTPATDYLTWHKLTIPNNEKIIHISGGDVTGTMMLAASGNLYGNTAHGGYMGLTNDQSIPTPTLLTSIMNTVNSGGSKITWVFGNSMNWHVILSNGQMWGWGDNAMGGVGNGDQINLFTLTDPFFVDPAGILMYPVYTPVRITNRSDWVKGWGDKLFGMGNSAKTSDGTIWYWGRNKGGIAGNGESDCDAGTSNSGTQAQWFPDSWDLKWPTIVNPWSTTNIKVMCEYCVTNPSNTHCSCSITQSTLHASAGSNQTVPGTTAQLSAAGSTAVGGTIIRYTWKQVSGPNTAIIDANGNPVINLSGLINGSYVFRVVVADNGWGRDSTTMTLTVGTTGPPIVSAGSNQLLVLPASSTTLTGTATAQGTATIQFVGWTQLVGPNTATIVSPGSLTTSLTGLIVGTYQFQLSATDSNGQTTTSTVIVIVSSTANFLTLPRRVSF